VTPRRRTTEIDWLDAAMDGDDFATRAMGTPQVEPIDADTDELFASIARDNRQIAFIHAATIVTIGAGVVMMMVWALVS